MRWNKNRDKNTKKKEIRPDLIWYDLVLFDLIWLRTEISGCGLVFQSIPANLVFKDMYSQHKNNHSAKHRQEKEEEKEERKKKKKKEQQQ